MLYKQFFLIYIDFFTVKPYYITYRIRFKGGVFLSNLGNKEVMAKNIQYYMDRQGIDRRKLSADLSISYTTLTDWLKAKTYPRIDKIEMLSNYFSISKADLVEERHPATTITQISDTTAKLEEPRQKNVLSYAERQLEEQLHEQEIVNNKVVPLVGKSAANPAALEYGDTDIEQQSFAHVPDNADCAIYIQGDSMEPLIKNGSIVFYKKQCDVENGEIAIVEIDGDGVTCKKLIKDYENERIILRSINKKYDDRVLKCEEIRIIGKVVM